MPVAYYAVCFFNPLMPLPPVTTHAKSRPQFPVPPVTTQENACGNNCLSYPH